MSKGKKLAIVTCCLDEWGGSEELWAKSIPILRDAGIDDITIFKSNLNPNHPQFTKLKHKGIRFKELSPRYPPFRRGISMIGDIVDRLFGKLGLMEYHWNKPAKRLAAGLKQIKPDLVLISQGINFDGLVFAFQCLKLEIPYLIVSHKAVEFFWPQAGDRAYMRETLIKARKCLFVSEHNRKLTEQQFGVKLTNSEIVVNPVKTQVMPLPYPETSKGFHLACIGRLFIIDKGQDILIKVLAQPKWKNKELTVSFYGKGPDKESLVDLANLLEVNNVNFMEYTDDLKSIWSAHHALILPSRSEGLPLTIIEAMSYGRTAIVTNAGGNNEIITDQITGFVGEANEKDFDEVMERAWDKRDEWEMMGKKAAEHIVETIPAAPEKIFANLLIDTLNEQSQGRP